MSVFVFMLSDIIRADEITVTKEGKTLLTLEGKDAVNAFSTLYNCEKVKSIMAFGGSLEIALE